MVVTRSFAIYDGVGEEVHSFAMCKSILVIVLICLRFSSELCERS